ncbi:MAG: L-aspartate oxidase [Pseudomonadota bacterium]|nr:L-aspartate oxidase [Pseudomonadota bacterium]
MIVDDFVTAPAVVVGGGIAGCATALALDGCVIVANEPVGGGSSWLAQGGIAAAMSADDSPSSHAADTLAVSAGLAQSEIAALVAAAAAERVSWLEALGVAFDRTSSGTLALGREAGHSWHRIVHAGGDRSGSVIMHSLRSALQDRPDIRIFEGFELLDIVTAGDRAAGVVLAGPARQRLAVLAPDVVLATGGIGACFDRTTNPGTSAGAGLAAAARCGVELADLEFVQFHPTALAIDADPLPLLTEALRGAGAQLLDDSGSRFMSAIHVDADLAPRDIVARNVHALAASGRSVFLDATGVRDLETRFPGACALARAAGLDPLAQPLPVTAAAHFHMGGIATDAHGASSMAGLWACGEVASTGLHGGNRLASNSLLEGLVFGERIAHAVGRARLPSPRGPLTIPRQLPETGRDDDRIRTLRRLVGNGLGPLRSGPRMVAALRRLDAWIPATRAEADRLVVARELLMAAIARRESRGAHQRADFPHPSAGPPWRSYRRPAAAPLETLNMSRSRVA